MPEPVHTLDIRTRLLAGGARQHVPFFVWTKKGTKESPPRCIALRVPNFSGPVRAAAQLALRARTVLADFPRTASKKLATQRGLKAVASDGFLPLCRRRDFRAWLGLPKASERCLSEASSFAAPDKAENRGVSLEAGRPSFSWPLKKSNPLPGGRGQTPYPEHHPQSWPRSQARKCPITKTP